MSGLSIKEQRLIHAVRHLSDDDWIIADYNIQSEETIHVVWKLGRGDRVYDGSKIDVFCS